MEREGREGKRGERREEKGKGEGGEEREGEREVRTRAYKDNYSSTLCIKHSMMGEGGCSVHYKHTA